MRYKLRDRAMNAAFNLQNITYEKGYGVVDFLKYNSM